MGMVFQKGIRKKRKNAPESAFAEPQSVARMRAKEFEIVPGEGIEPSPGVTPRGDFKSPASTVSPPRPVSKISGLPWSPRRPERRF